MAYNIKVRVVPPAYTEIVEIQHEWNMSLTEAEEYARNVAEERYSDKLAEGDFDLDHNVELFVQKIKGPHTR